MARRERRASRSLVTDSFTFARENHAMALSAPNLMPPPPADELDIPAYSSGRILTIDHVESDTLRRIIALWRRLKGERRFPAREAIAPRDFGKLLRHVTLLRVLDGGADYEFRIVGDVQVQAYGENFRTLRLSEVGLTHPRFAEGMKIFYEGIRMGRDPFGYRGWIGRDMPDTKFSYHELAYFPLGPSDDAVDHILVAGVYVSRGEFPIE
jgi:hypothetical protein